MMWHSWRAETAAVMVLALGLVAGACEGQGTRLPPIEGFLMDRAEEMGLARSAGPRGIGEDASVWVLTPTGYELAERGANGFHCFVGRGWSGPVAFTRPDGTEVVIPDARDPSVRAPHCFSPGAALSILPWHRLRTTALIAGTPFEELAAEAERALAAGELEVPGPGAFAYMTSPRQHLGPAFGAWRPHVMLYLPNTDDAAWGSRGFSNDFPSVVEDGTPWSVVVIPMAQFSDGSRPDFEASDRAESEDGG